MTVKDVLITLCKECRGTLHALACGFWGHTAGAAVLHEPRKLNCTTIVTPQMLPAVLEFSMRNLVGIGLLLFVPAWGQTQPTLVRLVEDTVKPAVVTPANQNCENWSFAAAVQSVLTVQLRCCLWPLPRTTFLRTSRSF